MCNPHLYHFNCWGDNAPLLIQATKNRDYLTFWFTLKTTLASINLADGPVFRKFINDFQRAIRQQWRVNVIDKEGKQYTLCKYFNEHYNLPVSSPKKEAPNSVPTQPEIEPVDATVLDVEDTIGGLF
jgi:hypothetical protein